MSPQCLIPTNSARPSGCPADRPRLEWAGVHLDTVGRVSSGCSGLQVDPGRRLKDFSCPDGIGETSTDDGSGEVISVDEDYGGI